MDSARNNQPSRRGFIKALGGGMLAPLGARLAAGAGNGTNRFNLLFIAVDDLRPELGCYGKPYAPSPNIDRLAAGSVRFTNHFVQVPTCGASRFALLTGRAPHESGVTGGNHAFYRGSSALSDEMLEGAQSMPELFRRSGYHTVCLGKISHTPDGRVFAYDGSGDGSDEVPNAWAELPTPFGPWKRGWGVFFAYEGGRHREDGHGHMDLMEFAAKRDGDLPDGLIANEAVDQLKKLKDRGGPFFLGVGFYKPHLPFVATEGDWEAVKDLDVPPAPHQEKPETAYWHKSGEFYKYDMPFDKTHPLAMEDQQTARRAYLACVRYTDRQIGKVLDALEETGLADSTIVVLWGDHGWHLGDSQLWGKHTPFERAVHSPLMIRVPGMANAGAECGALAETLDVYPTLVDLCDPSFRKTEHPLGGKSLAPLLRDPSGEVRDAALSYWNAAVSVRTQTHRLIAPRDNGEAAGIELYDMREGPDPVTNLAGREPELAKQLLSKLPPAGGG